MKALVLIAATVAACVVAGGTATAQSPTPSPAASASRAGSPSPSASPTATRTATPVPASTPPTPTPTPTPPVTNVPQFPSTPRYLRAFPGVEPDSWFVYASGFTPRVAWLLEEVLCPSLPCSDVRAITHDVVREDGTMTFYAQLGPAADPSHERVLAVVQTPSPAGPPPAFPVPAGAPSLRVAGHNPGVGPGYPAGTRTGIRAVDDVIALVEARDLAAVRARVVLKSGTTAVGTPVRGVASWQCQPYFQPEDNLDQVFEVPAGPVYAVFRVPNDPALPLRYTGATYGIAAYDGGVGHPPWRPHPRERRRPDRGHRDSLRHHSRLSRPQLHGLHPAAVHRPGTGEPDTAGARRGHRHPRRKLRHQRS